MKTFHLSFKRLDQFYLTVGEFQVRMLFRSHENILELQSTAEEVKCLHGTQTAQMLWFNYRIQHDLGDRQPTETIPLVQFIISLVQLLWKPYFNFLRAQALNAGCFLQWPLVCFLTMYNVKVTFLACILSTSIVDWNNWSLNWNLIFFLLENVQTAVWLQSLHIFYYCKI